jgi:hypothetical protein
MSAINQRLGEVLLAMHASQDTDGNLNPDDLGVIGAGFYKLGADMLVRRDKLSPNVLAAADPDLAEAMRAAAAVLNDTAATVEAGGQRPARFAEFAAMVDDIARLLRDQVINPVDLTKVDEV